MTAWTTGRAALGAQFLTLAAVPPGALLLTLATAGDDATPATWTALAVHLTAVALAGAALGRWAGSSATTVVLTGLLAGLLLAALDTALLRIGTNTTHAAPLWFAWALSCPMAAVLLCGSGATDPEEHQHARTHP